MQSFYMMVCNQWTSGQCVVRLHLDLFSLAFFYRTMRCVKVPDNVRAGAGYNRSLSLFANSDPTGSATLQGIQHAARCIDGCSN